MPPPRDESGGPPGAGRKWTAIRREATPTQATRTNYYAIGGAPLPRTCAGITTAFLTSWLSSRESINISGRSPAARHRCRRRRRGTALAPRGAAATDHGPRHASLKKLGNPFNLCASHGGSGAEGGRANGTKPKPQFFFDRDAHQLLASAREVYEKTRKSKGEQASSRACQLLPAASGSGEGAPVDWKLVAAREMREARGEAMRPAG